MSHLKQVAIPSLDEIRRNPGLIQLLSPQQQLLLLQSLRAAPTPAAKAQTFEQITGPEHFFSEVLGKRPTETALKYGYTSALSPDQQLVTKSVVENKFTGVTAGHTVGKRLALDTPVPVPSGWTTIGELQVGDELYGPEGSVCHVTALSEIEQNPDAYEVVFNDGSKILADAEHQWLTMTRLERKQLQRGKPVLPKVRTTQQIKDTLHHKIPSGQVVTNHSIDVTQPVGGEVRDLPIQPYTLGYWLGNGTRTQAVVTCGLGDEEVVEHIKAEGYTVTNKTRYEGKAPQFGIVDGFVTTLRSVGVLGNKHIPPEYMRASTSQRLALLQGLMDSDGWASDGASSLCEFCSTDKPLADGVFELVASLGMIPRFHEKRAMLNGEDYGPKYSVFFSPTQQVFRLKRKADRLRFDVQGRLREKRMIVAVNKVAPVPMRCLQVDSPSHCYLVGKGFVPTHNTLLAAWLVLWFLFTHGPNCKVITTAPTNRQVEALLWAEINDAYSRSAVKLPGRCLTTAIKTGYGNWFAIGFATRDDKGQVDGTATNMSGFHAENLLVVMDEATGIPPEVWAAIDGLIITNKNKLLAIGNPTDPASTFHEKCKNPRWNVIQMSCENHPNVLHDNPDIIPGATTKEWVEERLEEYGSRDSNLYKAKVTGEWPDSNSSAVISVSVLEAAQAQWEQRKIIAEIDDRVNEDHRGNCLGLDVAREGEDLTVLALARNKTLTLAKWHSGKRTDETADMVKGYIHSTTARSIAVDDTGVGGGVTDQLFKMQREGDLPPSDIFTIIPVNFAKLALSPEKYNRLKDQLWWELAQALKKDWALVTELDLQHLRLPRHSSLSAQLTRPIYVQDTKGRIDILDKRDSTDPRTAGLPSKSPDLACAIMLARFAWACTRSIRPLELPRNPIEATMSEFRKWAQKRIAEGAEERQNKQEALAEEGAFFEDYL